MAELILTPNLARPDDVYEKLVRLHDGLDEAESLKVWARFALSLANHVGDPGVIDQAIALARPSRERPSPAAGDAPRR